MQSPLSDTIKFAVNDEDIRKNEDTAQVPTFPMPDIEINVLSCSLLNYVLSPQAGAIERTSRTAL